MLPVIAKNVLESVRLLANVARLLADRTVDGITANASGPGSTPSPRPPSSPRSTSTSGTRRPPRWPRRRWRERKTIRQVVLESGYVERGDLTVEQLDEALDVLRMTHP